MEAMPKLPLSFLDVSSLFRSLGELGTIKKHLFTAGREVLLAIQSLLKIADGYVGAEAAGSSPPMTMILGYAQKTVANLVERLPQEEGEKLSELRGRVFETILSVIDHEIAETCELKGQKSQKSKMKQEVLTAIRGVLLKEMRKHSK